MNNEQLLTALAELEKNLASVRSATEMVDKNTKTYESIGIDIRKYSDAVKDVNDSLNSVIQKIHYIGTDVSITLLQKLTPTLDQFKEATLKFNTEYDQLNNRAQAASEMISKTGTEITSSLSSQFSTATTKIESSLNNLVSKTQDIGIDLSKSLEQKLTPSVEIFNNAAEKINTEYATIGAKAKETSDKIIQTGNEVISQLSTKLSSPVDEINKTVELLKNQAEALKQTSTEYSALIDKQSKKQRIVITIQLLINMALAVACFYFTLK